MSSEGWGRATRQGIFWSTASFIGGRALSFVSVLILARLLVPSEFGVVAAITAFLTTIDVISDVGMKATVIYEQEKGITPRVQTAFTVNLVFAIVLVGSIIALAPWIAGLFQLDGHVGLFRLASLNLLLTSLGNVHDSLLMRELDFRRRIIPDLIRQVARGIVSIVLAFAGLGAAALVIGMLAGSASWTVMQWILTPFRPTLSFDRAIARSMAGYGTGAAILNVVTALAVSVQFAVISRSLGEKALGIYTVALRVPELIVEMVAFNVSRVAFPALARKRVTDERGLGPATLLLTRYQALYAGPVAAGLAVLAQPLVIVLFGPKWEEAGAVLTPLAILSGIGSISFPLGDALKALGKQRYLIALNLVQMPAQAAAIVLVSSHGILAAAWVISISGILFNIGVAVVVALQADIPGRAFLSAAHPGVVAALGVAVGAGAVRLAWPAHEIGPLIAGSLAGAAGCLIALRLFAPGVIGEVVDLVRSTRRARGREASAPPVPHSGPAQEVG